MFVVAAIVIANCQLPIARLQAVLTPTHAAKFMHRQMQSTWLKPAVWSICSFHLTVTGTRTPWSA